jgi:hypothetical protein
VQLKGWLIPLSRQIACFPQDVCLIQIWMLGGNSISSQKLAQGLSLYSIQGKSMVWWSIPVSIDCMYIQLSEGKRNRENWKKQEDLRTHTTCHRSHSNH